MKTRCIILFAVIAVAIFGSLFFLARNHFKKLLPWFNSELIYFEEKKYQNEPETPHLPNALKVPIFIYHSVRPHVARESKLQDAYDITPELLEQQLAYLKDNNYTTITLDDLVRDLNNSTTSPITKPVILTFDDGWENQYHYAFPILKKYHMTATFYIFTNPIGKKPHFLTWNQIKEMDDAGMTIAAHTITHPYLQKISDAQLRREIFKSKQILEKHLEHPVLHFSSPFGFSDTNIEALLKGAGYRTGRTTYKGVYQDDPWRLRGILVSDSFDNFVEVLK